MWWKGGKLPLLLLGHSCKHCSEYACAGLGLGGGGGGGGGGYIVIIT